MHTNCYICWREGVCFVVDPGANAGQICEAIASTKCELKYILLTHGHFDHIGAVDEIKREFSSAKVVINAGDADFLISPELNGSWMTGRPMTVGEADIVTTEGQEIEFSETLNIKVLHTPGHSPGSCCYRAGNMLFTGDTLFKDDVGGTDLAGGSEAELELSLRRLSLMQGELSVLPGHGEQSMLGDEKQRNIYLR